MNEGSILTL